MSRTGNLLFPEDTGDGWVTSLIKALPEKKPEQKPEPEPKPEPRPEPRPEDELLGKLDGLDPAEFDIDDPVADAADAVFSTLAAETAERDAIMAAGWSASPVPTKPQPEPPPADRVALDTVVAVEGDDDPGFTAVPDPVSDAADAAFAGTAADTAAQEAIFAAGWSAAPVRPEVPEGETQFSPDAIAALDAVIAGDDLDVDALARIEDPVSLAADAAFAGTAAETATADAIAAAGWSAAPGRAEVPEGGAPFSPEALAALDAVIAGDDLDVDALARIEDPVSLAADAAFASENARQAAAAAADIAAWSPRSFRRDGEDEEAVAEGPAPEGPGALDGAIDDPVAAAADAAFAEVAAEVAARDAILAARRAGERPEPEISAAEAEAPRDQSGDDLGEELVAIPVPPGDLGAIDDPVALAADAAFAERAAELAITEAIFTAQWQADSIPAGAVVADRELGREPPELAFWEIADLVRAEAEIAFEDAAYDLAYSAVDSLVTGEAAALAAFDQAIASGADPEEALAAAIAAAEAVDPLAFGLARTAALTGVPGDFGIIGPGAAFLPGDLPGETPGDRTAASGDEAPPEEPETEATATATLGRGFNAGLAAQVLLGERGDDILVGAAEGFRFFLDPDVITPPGTGVRLVERDDLIILPSAARTNIVGTDGADFLIGTNGADAIGGREGDDFIYGDIPTNFQSGVHGVGNPLTNPTFSGGAGNDVISGGAGDDTIWGGSGDDQIHGDVPDPSSALAGAFVFPLGDDTPGDDEIHGGDGDDVLEGGGGADTLYGDAGADNIFGYAGDDVLVGGTGADTLTGGAGADEFVFEGGDGSGALAHAQSLGTDTIEDYSDTDGDSFGLSDADFGLGAAGTLTDGTDYFESLTATLSGTPLDASGGNAGPAIVVLGENAGTDGVAVYYTDDAAAMTTANSYQIADVKNANLSQIEAGDFNLRA